MVSLFARVFGTRPRSPAAVVDERAALGATAVDAPAMREEENDERAALVLARWSDAQRDEYGRHAAALIDATILLDEGHFAKARATFESVLAASTDPCFLLADVGRARFACGDTEGAQAALRAFLARATSDVPAERRFEAHLDLVRVAEEIGDAEETFTVLGAMVEDLPGDPRPTFLLAKTLRVKGHPEEALEIWASLRPDEPSSKVLEEAALCHFALGRLVDAERLLAEVVRRAKCRCGARVPESTAIALASIYERTGRAEEAHELLASVGRALACGH